MALHVSVPTVCTALLPRGWLHAEGGQQCKHKPALQVEHSAEASICQAQAIPPAQAAWIGLSRYHATCNAGSVANMHLRQMHTLVVDDPTMRVARMCIPACTRSSIHQPIAVPKQPGPKHAHCAGMTAIGIQRMLQTIMH